MKLKNRPSSIVNRQSQSAFTLIELMIVVSILGILAAIVYPEFQGHVQQAKEAQAKANLKLLRDAIERYAADHNGVPPGYFANKSSNTVAGILLKTQLVTNTKPYLRGLPENPFNNLRSIIALDNTTDMPSEAEQTDIYGWIYKPATKTIKLNWSGTDSDGIRYFDY